MDITPSEGLLSWEAVPRNGEATFSRVASILRKMEPGVSHRSECGLGTVVGRDIKICPQMKPYEAFLIA